MPSDQAGPAAAVDLERMIAMLKKDEIGAPAISGLAF
jgi:hypothetical protein